MSWDAKDVALLKELWAAGHSAGQIASRLGHSRNAVSAKLKRLGHKRSHKPPTANPRIVAVRTRKPSLTRKPALAAACARPVDRVVSKPKSKSKSVATPAREFTKGELYAMLASAVRNT
jgi:GcrA cell cycle regulator